MHRQTDRSTSRPNWLFLYVRVQHTKIRLRYLLGINVWIASYKNNVVAVVIHIYIHTRLCVWQRAAVDGGLECEKRAMPSLHGNNSIKIWNMNIVGDWAWWVSNGGNAYTQIYAQARRQMRVSVCTIISSGICSFGALKHVSNEINKGAVNTICDAMFVNIH